MPELMAIPSSEPDLEAADTVSAEPAHDTVVLRYRPDADSSGHSDDPEDNTPIGEPETSATRNLTSKPARPPVRVLTLFLSRVLVAIVRAGIRGTIRYPRTSVWTALSIIILGAILATRPANPTPLNQMHSSTDVPSSVDKGEPTRIDASKNPIEDGQRKAETRQNEKKAEKLPAPATQPPAPSPPQRSSHVDDTLAAEPPGSAPVPSSKSSPTQVESEAHPNTTTSSLPELPDLSTPHEAPTKSPQDSEDILPPIPSAADGSSIPIPLDEVRLPTSKEVTLPGGSESDALPTTPATPEGSEVTAQPNASSPPLKQSNAELNPKPTLPNSEPPKPASTPETASTKSEPPKSAPTTTTEPRKSEPPKPAPTTKAEIASTEPPKPDQPPKAEPAKSEPPKPAPTPKAEPGRTELPQPDQPPKAEPGRPAPATKAEPAKADPPKPDQAPRTEPTKSEASKPAEPSQAPGHSGPTLGPAPLELDSPAPIPETSRPAPSEQQRTPVTQDLGAEPKAPETAPIPGPEPPAPPPQTTKPNSPDPQNSRGVDAPETSTPGANVLPPGLSATHPVPQAPMNQPENQIAPSGPIPPGEKEAPKPPDTLTPATVAEGSGPGIEDTSTKKVTPVAQPGESTPAAPRSTTNPIPDRTPTKWVRLPNTGKISEVVGDRSDALGGLAGTAAEPKRDLRAHADRDISFETESTRSAPRTRSGDTGEQSGIRPAPVSSGIESPGLGSRLPNQPAPAAESAKVEAVPHIVERNENFWTISRLYYSSGRYYRALWKANAQKYPDIQTLHVKDVIMIPPVEDLDPGYIDPPRNRTARTGVEGTGRGSTAKTSSPPAGRSDRLSTARAARASNSSSSNNIPTGRSNRTDAVLNLPIGETALPRDHGDGSAGVAPTDEETVDDGLESRSTARPRISAKVNRPTYKVRRYDTLRSIARDMLGDPRRAREILTLNRDIIDDPDRLISGQLLELPEDADTRRVTARDRN
jgi:nucleoid-associated protein YgaU